MIKKTAQQWGIAVESRAKDYLSCRGLLILEERFRTRRGEIDLIVLDVRCSRHVLVFVEVKGRNRASWGRGLEAVGPQKAYRLRAAASAYMAGYRGSAQGARFDLLTYEEDASIPMSGGAENTGVWRWYEDFL